MRGHDARYRVQAVRSVTAGKVAHVVAENSYRPSFSLLVRLDDQLRPIGRPVRFGFFLEDVSLVCPGTNRCYALRTGTEHTSGARKHVLLFELPPVERLQPQEPAADAATVGR